MSKTKIKRKSSLIAAIIYAVYAVGSIISAINWVNMPEYVIKPEYVIATEIIQGVVLTGLAVSLFMNNKKAVIFAAGVNTLRRGYYLVKWFNLMNLFGFLSYVVFVVIAIMTIKGNAVAKRIWFLAGSLLFVGVMIDWIYYGFFKYNSMEVLLTEIPEIAALVFAGVWIKDDISTVADAPENEYTTFNPQGYSSTTSYNDLIGGADRLKMYKELLDSGTITQEEFDAKKKQVL